MNDMKQVDPDRLTTLLQRPQRLLGNAYRLFYEQPVHRIWKIGHCPQWSKKRGWPALNTSYPSLDFMVSISFRSIAGNRL